MCAGGLYCPLNPADPPERLVTLLEQTQGQYVLIHQKTREKFPSAAVQHFILLDDILLPWLDVKDIGNLPVCSDDDPIYIICTSGTTGRSKVVVHTHKSFSASTAAFIHWHIDMYTFRDQILQVATCSWNLHLTEISMPLVSGGTLVLFRPGGHLDMGYFCQTLIHQQVTTLTIGPGIIRAFTNYLEITQRLETFQSVRNLCTTGETVKAQEWIRFIYFLSSSNVRVIPEYGMSECNGVLGCQLLDITDTAAYIGSPLPGVQCLLINEHGQTINNTDNSGEIGQVYIGGPTLFKCYLNDPELTDKMLVTIGSQVYLRTGDLARYSALGELVHVGRVDFQLKVRGQRVETVEIENTIIDFSPDNISNCLVIKMPQNDDLLIAYIISNDFELPIEEIRDYCNKHLSQYKVPSYYVVLDKFPLNTNGKIDRKQLPFPSLHGDPIANFVQTEDQPMSKLEEEVHSLWCSTLRLDVVPRHMNCFALGGSSLSVMQLFNYYQFHLAPDKQLNVLDFFVKPTITEHARLLINNSKAPAYIFSSPLHLVQGMASSAQQRLWIDEKVRFNESVNRQTSIYNELLVYKLSSNTTFCTHRLRQALIFIVAKHTILRTALIYDEIELKQKVQPTSSDLYSFEVTYIENDDHLKQILYDEETNRSLFDLEQGRVFRCHILRRSSNNKDDTNLKQNDIILFNFHHTAIDGSSITIFINDLRQALINQQSSYSTEGNITYLDYAQYERMEDWSSARQYWSSVLTTLNNSFDQQNSSVRTGNGYTVTFDLDYDLVMNLNCFMSQSNSTLFQVGLATFFSFLFKMNNSQQLDFCTGIVVANRSQYQLQNMIGFFANTLPFCLKIDPYESFTQLCYRIQQLWLDILPHTHLPYQEIVKLDPKLGSSFLQTFFNVSRIIDNSEQNIELDKETTLNMVDHNLLFGNTAKFDMTCTIHEHCQNKTIYVSLNASLDVYDESTISMMGSRLKIMFEQLFSVPYIHQFSLLLPHETKLIHDLNDTFLDYAQIGCIHWDFACQAHLHPQKVALGLENGTMTYGELLYYAQQLANHLINNCSVRPGQTVCQLIERSFEMVIGMIGIWMSGGVYNPLNLHDSQTQRNTCIRQTDAHFVLVHQRTHDEPLSGCSIINVDQVIGFTQMNKEVATCIDSVNVTSEHISCIIFTSDLLGLPKAVQIRHRNFISCNRSNIMQQTDVVLHHTSVTFNVHLSEIAGALIMGGQVVLLHPNGDLNMKLFSQTIHRQQVTILNIVSSSLTILTNYIRITNNNEYLKTLRCISFAKCTGAVTQYMITTNKDDVEFLPIGRPMPNTHIYLLDDYLQPIIPGVQTGQIVIGGVGLFAGYYGREDLTHAVLCEFTGEVCYKTGDLGWLNTANGQLEFRGHRDHHAKLRSQPIELEKVEAILMEMATCCAVIKAKYEEADYLVAYVQTTHTIQDLKQHCVARLPFYMIPSIFMICDILPVDQNGSINQKDLPPPDFTRLSILSNENIVPRTEMEQRVYKIWHQALANVDSIPSILTSFFSLGDDPESFIKLFCLYSTNFKHTVPITTFLQQPTIAEHARLLIENATLETTCDRSHSIDITESPASFAQARIWCDERIRFDPDKPQIAIYNVPFVYRLQSTHTLSIKQLRHALHLTVNKHPSLHTSLHFDPEKNLLMQRVITHEDEYTNSMFSIIETNYETSEQLNEILHDEKRNPHLFDLAQGLVFRCHIIYYKKISSNDLLSDKDVLIFNFHHASFDFPSMEVFHHDLSQAYTTGQLSFNDGNTLLRYIDYAVIEQQMSMTGARMFWLDALHDCKLDQPLSLPFDRYHLSNEHRTSRGTSVSFDFGQDLSQHFLNHASSDNISLEHLTFAIYFIFLFKLTNGQTDLCIAMNINNNRYRDEFKSIIGLFENVIPLRCQLDPQWCFPQLLEHIQEIKTNSMKYSYFPLQRILNQHPHISKHAFLDTSLEFISLMKHPQKLAVELDEQSLTYCELLHYVQVLSLSLLSDYLITPGEIVCQCVERSLSMVIGIMAIEMAGGVYCPLSPRDPQHRLHALTQQTQSRLVLVHHLTKIKFDDDVVSLNIDSILNVNNMVSDMNYNCLSSWIMKGEEIAYIIFTSGSSGIPKAVQLRQQNFINSIIALVQINTLHESDIVIQIASSTFDAHVQEIVGSLICGATIVMLHPQGESMSSAFIKILMQFVAQSCRIWNLYGPAEATLGTSCHLIDVIADMHDLPIGKPLPRYMCLVLNNYLQPVMIQKEGEILVGGLGVFAGYLGRNDLTAKALIEIDDELFYRTGDLVRMDNNGLLHYQGRKDHQIKLHGQRIELGEIKRCLLSMTTISACVVMKWKDDYLVAYVQSSHINEEQIRQHCQSHLPPHMIPSIFIILDKLPLNSNGKIDRKLLPPPHFSSIHLTDSLQLLLPTNDIEVSIHHIWCEILKQNHISADTNIFTIGGHSLLIMQIFHRYKIEFHLQTNTLSISNLFQQPTIIHHAQLIQQSINTIHTLDDYAWSSLHLIQAPASFAQERIFLDEQIRFPSKHHNFMYVIPLVYRILSTNNHLSIDRLHRALHTVVAKHRVLRTGFYLDINGMIIQHCLDINATINDQEPYGFSVVDIDSDVESNEVAKKIISRSDLFDLSKGRVLNCHIVHRHDFNDLSYNKDTLVMGDLIIFLIHHIVFDGASVSTFLNDLSLAYTNDCMLHVDENAIQCIDSTVYERLMDMTQSHEFWNSQLKDYNFTRSLSLPVDRYCLSTDYRSGLHFFTEICFDDDISTAFLEYATLHHITPFQLAMSIFYAFLFKLTDGQDDLCFSCLHANRYRTELQNIIGMFVATLPFRIQINSHWSFENLAKHAQENCLSIFQHTHYPLQHILADFRRNYSNVSFLDILFELVTVSPDINKLSLDGSNLKQVSLERLCEAVLFDVDVIFVYDPTVETGKLSCYVYGSRDVFDETTVNKIGRKLQAVFSQIFTTKSRVNQIDKLSLALPDEIEVMQKVTFHHLSDINNKDYQIKSHGQRIELGEIEQCLLNTSISACVVMKWDDDRLIAYVESCDMTEKELYEYCQSHLPFYMIPSMFIILENLPRNNDGTVDQDLLRKSHLATMIKTDSLLLIQLEARLLHIFSQALGCESPDVTQPFSEMGGTSLDVLRMLSLIQKDICPIINGSHLFANPSIQKLTRTIESLLAISNKITLPFMESIPLTPYVPLRVAIIGCDIGGLSAAIALRRHGHEVTVYEHAHFASEVGASVSIAANGTKFLEEWGINTVAGRSVILQKLIMRNWTDGTINDVYNLSDYKEKWGYVYNAFHRTDLHEQLHIKAKALGVMIVIDHKAIDVDCVNRTVTFDTGSKISVDLIIGADGIRSTVRSLIGIVAKMTPSTSACHRCSIPTSRVKQLGLKDFSPNSAIEFWGGFDINKIVLAPCCAGEIISFYCFSPPSYNHQSEEGWNFSATPSMLIERFPDLDPDLLAIFKHCEDIKLWKLAIHEPYPYWVKGCVALLGDAAHPMLPDQSQGVCMEIEDAAALGIIFSPKYWGNKILTVERGLKMYELLRKTRATRVQETSVRVPENFNEKIGWSSQGNHDAQQSAATKLTIDEINAYDMQKHLDDLLN
ncbi:unnamed protein product [Adineta steineri]|uniref:Carrier domain-containing protein n=1 Tax=Adineta steineri TaxID=433720 RepID=A0A815HNP5_9BILA|nr:unnamed protein product [Adineta steineri]CAF1598024.1 unnamed protein product [Adineta steineri]